MSSIGDNRFPDGRNLFLAWSTFTGPRETFNDWYDEEHIPQILSAPGMIGAQRFVLDETEPLPGTESVDYGHLALYELNGDPSGFREEVKRQLMSGEMVIPDFMNPPFTTLILKATGAPSLGEAFHVDSDLGDRHLFLEFSRYTGDYKDCADWYEQLYIPRISRAPGLYRVQRFVQSEVKPLPGVATPDVRHLTIFEIAGSPSGFRDSLEEATTSGDLEIPEFLVQPVGASF